jgi:hypothetical protein
MNLTRDEVEVFMDKFKKRGERTLSLMGKLQDFNNAVNDPMGKLLLDWLITQHEMLLDKIANLTASDNEKIKYTVVREMLLDWCGKIQTYKETINDIKKVSQKGDLV